MPEGNRIDAERVGELVHVRLAGEVVGRRGERAVGPPCQPGRGGLVALHPVRHPVRGFQAGRAGVNIRERPGQQPTLNISAAGHVDDGGGAQVAGRELVGAGPLHLDRPPRGPGQPRGLHRDDRAVLAAEAAAEVRHHDVHAGFAEAERGGQLLAGAERRRRSGPDRQLVAVEPG